MRIKHFNYVKKFMLPCLVFSSLTGFFSAIFITVFKILTEIVIGASVAAYGAVRENPAWIPVLVLAAAAIGLGSSFIYSFSHSCRGGGIPSSIAAVRGIVSFKWVAGILLLPVSALMTFLAGLPLGTEGPCVQMGTAVGDGVIKCIGGEKHKGWRRYVMTGGASAGFSIATASPISAFIFSIEELQKQFSPMLLGVVSVSVVTAQITVRALAALGIGSVEFFHVPEYGALSLKLLFIPILIGVISGGCSAIFGRIYNKIDHLMHRGLKKIPVRIIYPVLFALVAIVGFFLADTLGTGHSLIDSLFEFGGMWYVLILVFLVRAITMMVSNTSGVTGGIFLPTISFGAIVGALCADAMIALGWIDTEHYTLMVVLGIASFLGATSKIPMTACVFAVEALGGISNVLPIIITTTVSVLIVECSGVEDLTETIIEAKLHKITKGKQAISVEVPLTVAAGSFVEGKELCDVLWPNSCVVVSFNRANRAHDHLGLYEGDVITVHYTTYNPAVTIEELHMLVGKQSDEIIRLMDPAEKTL